MAASSAVANAVSDAPRPAPDAVVLLEVPCPGPAFPDPTAVPFLANGPNTPSHEGPLGRARLPLAILALGRAKDASVVVDDVLYLSC